MEIRQVRFTHGDVLVLVEAVQVEYAERYGSPDDTPLEPEMFSAPRGAFFVGYLDGTPVAMGGWKFLPGVAAFGRSRTAEIKRMYVVREQRRRGLANAMLEHLELTAGLGGADLLVLETGIEQPEAIAMYTRAGYRPVEAFGHYTWSPKSRHLGKPLD